MKYDLVTLELQPTKTLFLQSTDPEALEWLLSILDGNYPYAVQKKLTLEFASGQPFRYGITCREGRKVLFFLVQQLCHHGWKPLGCSLKQTWVMGGFFQRASTQEPINEQSAD